MTYKLVISDDNALTLAEWFLGLPPGIRVWHSIDLGNLDQQWITPIEAEDKPHWRACNLEEAEEIRDPRQVAVVIRQEVDRFPINTRLSGNGLTIKLTDESTDLVNEALEGRGQFAISEFDYDTVEAVILDAVRDPIRLDVFAGLGEEQI